MIIPLFIEEDSEESAKTLFLACESNAQYFAQLTWLALQELRELVIKRESQRRIFSAQLERINHGYLKEFVARSQPALLQHEWAEEFYSRLNDGRQAVVKNTALESEDSLLKQYADTVERSYQMWKSREKQLLAAI